MPNGDPIEAFVRDALGPAPGSSRTSRPPEDKTAESRTRTFTPLTVVVAVLAVGVWWAPGVLTAPDVARRWVGAAAAAQTLLDLRSRVVVLVAAAVVIDLVRLVRRHHRRVFAVLVEQTTGRVPRAVRLSAVTSRHSTRRAQILLPTGTVVDEAKLAKTRDAASALLVGAPPMVRARSRASVAADTLSGGRMDQWTAGRIARWKNPGEWEYATAYSAREACVTVDRRPIAPDTRSERHRMLAGLLADDRVLQGVTVTVAERDEHGDDVGFRIHYKQTLTTGLDVNRHKLTEALLAALGTHESGQLWRVDWHRDEPVIALSLRDALPTLVLHCRRPSAPALPAPDLDHRGIGTQDMEWPSSLDALTDRAQSPQPQWLDKTSRPVADRKNRPTGRRLHVPYATCETDDGLIEAFWNVSDRSSAPHMLVVGPTGGGKTVLLTTLITEMTLRGIPVICVDPKRIELHQFLGYPGVPAVVFDALRAALFIEALHAEMMARTKYMQTRRIKPSKMPLLVAVLDEFFILSAAWTHLKQNGTKEEVETLKRADPLGKIGQLVALARSTGIRLGVGVQRPDAQLFGRDAGGVRDNFKTRASLARLSPDGAYMFWADTDVGRDIDAQIPGRATVTDAAGDPALAQVWLTPTVDMHPAARADMSEQERQAVDSLRPAVDAPVQCFSTELPAFLADEQAVIETMEADIREPLAVTAGTIRQDIERRYALADSIADGVAADSLTAGTFIVLDLPGEAPRTVEVLGVEVVRPAVRDADTAAVVDDGEVHVQIAADSAGSRRAVDVITYTALDTVMLAAPELVGA